MKEAPHEAGPEARNNNRYTEINIGLASPQYNLAEPGTQRDLAFRVASREGPHDG